MLITDLHKYLDKPCRGAIHVGANIGEERDWYVQNGFTKVVWFEPNPELVRTLDENICNYDNQISFNFGIHDTLKKAVLHIANNGGQSSSLLPLGTHKIYHPEVRYVKDCEIKLIRLDEFFKLTDRDIDDFNFLNVDVEGTELNVLKSLGDLIRKLDYIYSEVCDEYVRKECALISEIDTYLNNFNFKRVVTKITKAHWGDALYRKEGEL